MQDSMAHGGAVSEETVSADFLTRFLAILIDGLILMVPLMIAFLVLPVALYYVLSLVVGAGYNVYFWSTTGQTIGKRVMGLKVVSAETGQILDVQGAVIRYVCTIVSGIPLGLGYFWALWDPKHDTWHDKLAKTKVIKVAK